MLGFEPDKLKVRYERSEVEAEYSRLASADFSSAGSAINLTGTATTARIIRIGLGELDVGQTRIEWHEDFDAPIEDAHRAELNLWFDAALGYLAIAARRDRRGRAMRWLLDRVWLKMSPTGRRVGLLIVGMEMLALLLFIAVLIVYRLLG